MKKILFLITLLVSSAAYGAGPDFIYKATPGALGCTDGYACPAAVDSFGRLYPSSSSAAMGEVTPVPAITILPTALPTAFSTPQFSNSGALKTRTICNTTNELLLCANDMATPIPYPILANTCETQNFFMNGQKMSTGIGCIHPSNTPTGGSVLIFGSR